MHAHTKMQRGAATAGVVSSRRGGKGISAGAQRKERERVGYARSPGQRKDRDKGVGLRWGKWGVELLIAYRGCVYQKIRNGAARNKQPRRPHATRKGAGALSPGREEKSAAGRLLAAVRSLPRVEGGGQRREGGLGYEMLREEEARKAAAASPARQEAARAERGALGIGVRRE